MTIEEAYKTKRTLLLYSAQKMVGTLAADVVQNVFLKLAIKYGNEDVEGLENIIFRSVRNECINHKTHLDCIEKYKHSITISEEYTLLNIEFEFVNLVYDKVKLLPKKCRQCIELFYFEELTTTEIAKLLNISRSAVTTQLQRGRYLLRPYFKSKSLYQE